MISNPGSSITEIDFLLLSAALISLNLCRKFHRLLSISASLSNRRQKNDISSSHESNYSQIPDSLRRRNTGEAASSKASDELGELGRLSIKGETEEDCGKKRFNYVDKLQQLQMSLPTNSIKLIMRRTSKRSWMVMNVP